MITSQQKPPPPSCGRLRRVVAAACVLCGVSHDEYLCARTCRQREWVRRRVLIAWLARRASLSWASYNDLADAMNATNHSTVINMVRRAATTPPADGVAVRMLSSLRDYASGCAAGVEIFTRQDIERALDEVAPARRQS